MENRSVAKLSTKKALSSLRSFLCCNGNDEDKININIRNEIINNSPYKDRPIDDFDVTAFVNKILNEQICRHGNPGSVCVSCYFSTHGNLDDYIITRPSNIYTENGCYDNADAGTPDSCVKEPVFVYDNKNFHEHYEHNNFPDYENIPNYNDKQLQVTIDTDNVSLCSSCYHSNCTMCREEEEAYYVSNGDKTEFSVECSTPNFDPEGLRKLLRKLNPSVSVSCVHGNQGNASQLLCCQAEEIVSVDTASTVKSKNDKDSGVGRTDDSVKQDESSEQDVFNSTSPSNDVDVGHHHSNDSFTSNSTGDSTTTEDQLIKECDRFHEALEQRCGINFQHDVFKTTQKYRASKPEIERIDSQSSIERDIRVLNEEMTKIQLECQEIVDAHKNEPVNMGTDLTLNGCKQDTRCSPSRVVPRMGTRLDYAKQQQLQQELQEPVWIPRDSVKHTVRKSAEIVSNQKSNIILPLGEKCPTQGKEKSGAKQATCRQISSNSGQKVPSKTDHSFNEDICRNAPLTLEFQQSGKPSLTLKTPYNGEYEKALDETIETKCSVSKSMSNSSVNQITQTPEPNAASETLQELYSQYADVMYTNQANLQHTIMLQQKLFQQKISQQHCASTNGSSQQTTDTTNNSSSKRSSNNGQKHERKVCEQSAQSQAPCPNGTAPHGPYSASAQTRQGESSGTNASNVQMEWVVKRRADGSRYIARRPMRSKMLKERARKINEERSGMTTDDDAMSELKVGRYWSKDERKRHVEQAREYKRRKQLMLRQRMETVKETDDQRKEPNILELSQRKMMKHKSRKMFDDFTTVQEMLVHGSKNNTAAAEVPQPTAGAPLLSVTTV